MVRGRKNKVWKYKLLSAILFLVVVALGIYVLLPNLFIRAESLFIPEFSLKDFTKIDDVDADITNDVGVVMLKADCYELTAVVEPTQAISIDSGLNKVVGARPNTHDLAKDVFETLGIEVMMVKITEIKDDAYFAKILLRQGNKYLNFDVRPSDGVAVALRTNASMYINSSLLKEMGEKVC